MEGGDIRGIPSFNGDWLLGMPDELLQWIKTVARVQISHAERMKTLWEQRAQNLKIAFQPVLDAKPQGISRADVAMHAEREQAYYTPAAPDPLSITAMPVKKQRQPEPEPAQSALTKGIRAPYQPVGVGGGGGGGARVGEAYDNVSMKSASSSMKGRNASPPATADPYYGGTSMNMSLSRSVEASYESYQPPSAAAPLTYSTPAVSTQTAVSISSAVPAESRSGGAGTKTVTRSYRQEAAQRKGPLPRAGYA